MEDKRQKTEMYYSRNLVGNLVVQEKDLRDLGKLVDILIEPNLLEVAAIKTSQNKWLERPSKSIPSKELHIQKNDVILVRGFNLHDQNYEEDIHWLSLNDLIHGQKVISAGGAELGEIEDIKLDDRGTVVAYQMKWEPEIMKSEKYEFTKHDNLIPVIATHALDSKVMIVNETVLIERG